MRILLGTASLAIALSMMPLAARAQTAAPQPVEIALADFDYTPKELHLRQGQAYRLRFVNTGSGGHNFSAPEFFASAKVDPADVGAVAKGKVEIGKGEAREVRLTPAAGTYKVKCTHFMHSAFGMKGRIVVD